jgi:wyosine [tRNA(Phe)-imidazoG37] synthetase (radical SAM superfamily)
LYCEAVDGLYLKANGELPCWCSPGEHQPILRLAPGCEHQASGFDLVRDVLHGEAFTRMRRELHENRLPFSYCRGCWFLRKSDASSFHRIDPSTFAVRSIRCFQVESSFLCNVDCPLCVRLPDRRSTKEAPYQLPFDLFKKAVDDLAAHGIAVEEIWFSGRGEPLMNPDLPKMALYGKQRLGARVTTHTNANFQFRPEFLNGGFDEISLSIDGVTQESYERYRRGGSLERAIRFSHDFAAARRAAGLTRPRLLWKMVLFEWNSSDEHLRRAVEWAGELGLDGICFMNTDTPGGVSYRNDHRIGEIKALVDSWVAPPVKVEIIGFKSAYGARPEVDLTLRVDRHDGAAGPRDVLLGRLFNHMLETRAVRARVELQDEYGSIPLVLADASFELEERSEMIASVDLPLRDKRPGTYAIVGRVSDRDSGLLLHESTLHVEVPAESA